MLFTVKNKIKKEEEEGILMVKGKNAMVKTC